MLTFKEGADLKLWRATFGRIHSDRTAEQRQAISWVTLFNSMSVQLTSKSAVVTSWHRYDDTAHYGGEAVDFRTRHYSRREKSRLQRACIKAGIPLIIVAEGTPNEHWHCGQVATLASERP